MKNENTDALLNTLTSMAITCYNLGVMGVDFDLSIPFSELTQELKHLGVTLEQIDESIKNKDFTDMLTDNGVGKRERCFVMETIKEYYND